MLSLFDRCRSLSCLVVCLLIGSPAVAQQVSPGFKSELVLAAPEIEHPSVVTCDDQGNLFVGEDPMDMRGPATEEFDRVLLLRFDPAGGPPRKTVFCDKLSAVFGLLWHEGALYVMHAPHYSVFRDLDGDGIADERRDLAKGFGPPAGVFGFNDHIVSGISLGLDGLVYVSVGDKGIARATGADGSTVTLEGGGIVRMRPDGTQLEGFTSGTRNHLDLAFDSLDNIFTYDNTDDGLGWWTRLTHHVATGYYGYPYDYHPHPERHLPHINEHGGGSPCGAACYREAAWPPAYRDNAFFCEWGKGKVQRFSFQPAGATFTAQIEDFMVNDGSGEFRPQDLCFSPDGRAMYVADWNYGGWLKPEQRGRLYRVTYVGDDVQPEPPRVTDEAPLADQVAALAHPARSQRLRAQRALVCQAGTALAPLAQVLTSDGPAIARVHALAAQNALLEQLEGASDREAMSKQWIERLNDPAPEVRVQAARLLGLRRVAAARLALVASLADSDPRVRRDAAVALGRIGDREACEPLWRATLDEDRFVSFSARQALRAINGWDGATAHLDDERPELRREAALTLNGVYDEAAVAALVETAAGAKHLDARVAALAALAEVHRRADPYTGGWWGTQPARGEPARAKKHDWSATARVMAAVRGGLDQPSAEVRAAAAQAVATVDDRDSAPQLRTLAANDPDDAVRLAAIGVLSVWHDREAVDTLSRIAANQQISDSLRQAAVSAIIEIGAEAGVARLIELLAAADSPPPLVVLCLKAAGELKPAAAGEPITARLGDDTPEVRAAAAQALAAIEGPAAVARLIELLADRDAMVRQAAVRSLGTLRSGEAVPALIAAASDEATTFEALEALTAIPDRRALPQYLQALAHPNQALRGAARAALAQIREEVAADLLALAERRELPAAIFGELDVVYSSPVPVAIWQVLGAWPKSADAPADTTAAPNLAEAVAVGDRTLAWKEIYTDDARGRVSLHRFLRPRDSAWCWAYTPLRSEQGGPTRLLLGSDDQAIVWVNGQQVYDFGGNRGWAADQAELTVELEPGVNHLWIKVGNDGGPWEFSVQQGRRDPRFAFLADSSAQGLDASIYREFALANEGNPQRGAQLFADLKGLGCIKCHAVGGGAKAGPDLAGVGAKYARDELIRSVLEPSSRILSGYELSTVITSDGRALQGVVKQQTDELVELIDTEGQTIRLRADEVEAIERGALSMMPAGLKDGLTPADFADVIAYLVSLKDQK